MAGTDAVVEATIARLQEGDVVIVQVKEGEADPVQVAEAFVRAFEKVGLEDKVSLVLADVETFEVKIVRAA